MVLPKQTHTKVVMSPAMTSQLFLNSMLGQIMELKHRATNTLTGPGQVPPATKSKQSHLFFIDDLNMASSNPEGGKWLFRKSHYALEKYYFCIKGCDN